MLVSENYRKQQEKLHATGLYGNASIKYAELVSAVINKLQAGHVLDYGCGSLCNLGKHLKVDHKFTYQAYDPCVEKYSAPPVPAEFVACIDVLEHIEPEYLEDVLDDLQRVTEHFGLFTVHTAAAYKTLDDGRNAHLIQQPMEWWLPKFAERFELQTVQKMSARGFYVIVEAKPREIENTDGEVIQ